MPANDQHQSKGGCW